MMWTNRAHYGFALVAVLCLVAVSILWNAQRRQASTETLSRSTSVSPSHNDDFSSAQNEGGFAVQSQTTKLTDGTELLKALRKRKSPAVGLPSNNDTISIAVQNDRSDGHFAALGCYKTYCWCDYAPDSTLASWIVQGTCNNADLATAEGSGSVCSPVCVAGYTPNGDWTCSTETWVGNPCQVCGAVFGGCASCSTSSRVCTACVGGYYSASGGYPTTACYGCSGACPPGSYQSVACTSTSDRQCAGCGTAQCQSYSSGCSCSFCNPSYYANTGGSCSACNLANCVDYSSQCSCQDCVAGYTGTDCHGCGSPACVSYSSGCNCNGCSAGYYVSGVVCAQCGTPNCVGYSTGCTCNSCGAGFVVNNGNCAGCGVGQCTGYSSGCSCNACNPGYFPSGGQCSTCSTANCVSYSSGCNCGTCATSFKTQSGTCVGCGVSQCLSYSSACVCSSCSNGYLVSMGVCVGCGVANCQVYGGNCQCSTCAPGYTGATCSACPVSNCLTFSVGCTCSNCAATYSLTAQGTCSACSVPFCTGYVPNTCNCNQCPSGRFLQASNGQCTACSGNCLTCVDKDTSCTSCPTGAYLLGITCLPCQSPCSQCVNQATQCTTCVSGYFLSNAKCFACSCGSGQYITVNCPGSGTTNSPTCAACSSCGVGQYISTGCSGFSSTPTTGDRACSACAPCDAGKFISTQCTGSSSISPSGNQVCSPCANRPCATGQHQTGASCTGSTTSDSQTCTACGNGFPYSCGALITTGTTCSGLTQADTQTCATCNLMNCVTCSANGLSCDVCGEGYYIQSSGCSACLNGGTLYTCAYGSFRSGTLCTGSTSTDTQTCTSCSSALSSCVQCNSNTQCVRTSAGYYIGTTGAGIQCGNGGSSYHCPDGTYITGQQCSGYSTIDTQTCSSCVFPCAACAGSASTCTACVSGYSLSVSSCLPDPCAEAPKNPMGGAYSAACLNVPSGQYCTLSCASGYNITGPNPVCLAGSYINIPSCADINECAVNNGGCGASVCSNIPGSAVCAVVNQCATNNGYCDANTVCEVTGPGRFACQDINECATDNGACGETWEYICTNTYGSRVCTDIGACANVTTCTGNSTCHANIDREWGCVCNPGFVMQASECLFASEFATNTAALSPGAAAGVSIVVILVAIGAGVAIFFFLKKRRTRERRHLRKLEALQKGKSTATISDKESENSTTSRGEGEREPGSPGAMTSVSLSHAPSVNAVPGGGPRVQLSASDERAFLLSFPKRKTTAELDEYFNFLHSLRDKNKSLETLSQYVHPLKFNSASAPEQFARFCEGDNLQRWVFPFLFKNVSASGGMSTSLSLDGNMSGSASIEQSLFEIAMVLIVDVHYEQFLKDAPTLGVTTVSSVANATSSASHGGVFQVNSGLERTFQWLKHSSDWSWQNEAITFTRLILYTYCTKVLNKWNFRDSASSIPYQNMFELCHVVDLFLIYSPPEQDGHDAEFGMHVDATGFLDAVLVEQMVKLAQKAETTTEKLLVEPAPKEQRDHLSRIGEELDYFTGIARFIRDATAYLDAFEKVDSKAAELSDQEAKELSDKMSASEKALEILLADRVYQKKKLAKRKNILQMLDDSMAEIQDLKRQRRGVKKLGAIVGFAQDRLGQPRPNQEKRKAKSNEEAEDEFGGITAKIIEDAHAEDLSDRELKEIRKYFTDANLLGQGAYGRVYKAEFRGEDVAVKVLDATTQSARKVAENFEKELRVHMHLRSPRLVNIIRVHRKPPEFLMVMECMDRGNLRQFLKNEPSVTETQRVELAVQIMRGVTFLHQNEPPIAHRDLKPENVLVDHSLNCKLCDFGLSALQTDTEAAHKLAGSGLYMAPEVFMMFSPSYAGSTPDFLKADMYSLGIVLIELFGGKIPWMGKNFQQIVEAHVSKAPREVPATITNSGVRQLIQACMNTNPDSRPSIRQALKLAQNLLNADKATSSPCDECEKEQPTIRCDQCQQTLCLACSDMLHRKGKRQAHILTPFAPSISINIGVSAHANTNASSPASSPRSVLQPVVMTGGAVRAAQEKKDKSEKETEKAKQPPAAEKRVLHESPNSPNSNNKPPVVVREASDSVDSTGEMSIQIARPKPPVAEKPPASAAKAAPSPPKRAASASRIPALPALDSSVSVSVDLYATKPKPAVSPSPSPNGPSKPAVSQPDSAAARKVVRSSSLKSTPSAKPGAKQNSPVAASPVAISPIAVPPVTAGPRPPASPKRVDAPASPRSPSPMKKASGADSLNSRGAASLSKKFQTDQP